MKPCCHSIGPYHGGTLYPCISLASSVTEILSAEVVLGTIASGMRWHSSCFKLEAQGCGSLPLKLPLHLTFRLLHCAVEDAFHWLKSTFFYVRVHSNPTYYQIPKHLSQAELEAKVRMQYLHSLRVLERRRWSAQQSDCVVAYINNASAVRLLRGYSAKAYQHRLHRCNGGIKTGNNAPAR